MIKLIFTTAALTLASCATPDAITYEDIAGRPRQEQIATMMLASPEEMAAIYRAHLDHVAALPDVTPDERAVLARVGSLVTPEWYAGEDAAGADEAEQLVRGLSRGTLRAVAVLGAE
jgi:hypothetical protein